MPWLAVLERVGNGLARHPIHLGYQFLGARRFAAVLEFAFYLIIRDRARERFQRRKEAVAIQLRGIQATGNFSGKVDPLVDRKSTRLNSSHRCISYAVFCLKKK